MAQAYRVAGPNAKIYWISSAGTADLSGDLREFSIDREMETTDSTAGNDTARYMKPTIKKFSAELSVIFTGTAGSAVMNGLTLGALGTLQVYPEGSATGKAKGSWPLVVINANYEGKFDDIHTVSVSFDSYGDEIWNPLTEKV